MTGEEDLECAPPMFGHVASAHVVTVDRRWLRCPAPPYVERDFVGWTLSKGTLIVVFPKKK